MTRYLTITIDVEPDCSPNWRYSSPLTFKGVHEGIAKRLQPLFNKYNIAATYLINNVVLEDRASCTTFKNLAGRFELGTHLHPEFIEPEKTKFDYAGQKGEANCCFYDAEIEEKKINSITSLFHQQFGFPPRSFRAGRFSAGNNTVSSLAQHKYLVETSVTPHVNWNDKTREKPVNYSSAIEQPYFMEKDNLLQQSTGNKEMLQVPVTIGLKKANIFSELKKTYLGLKQPVRKERAVWLRPVFSTYKDFIWLIEDFNDRYRDKESIVFNMMFHNVEVMPGLSPYTQTEEQCMKYLWQLEQFFIYCSQNNIVSVTLSELYDIYKK